MATMRKRMATMVFLVFVASVATVALGAPRASAADFTFKVPVQVSNMDPSVTALKVQCAASGAEGYSNSVPLDTATGSFSGTVTCEVSMGGALPPQDVKTYRVNFVFYQGGSVISNIVPFLKPGAPVTLQIYAPIP